jgi:hypothetical protein
MTITTAIIIAIIAITIGEVVALLIKLSLLPETQPLLLLGR